MEVNVVGWDRMEFTDKDTGEVIRAAKFYLTLAGAEVGLVALDAFIRDGSVAGKPVVGKAFADLRAGKGGLKISGLRFG